MFDFWNSRKVYIDKVSEESITLNDGTISHVLEFIPEDCGQKNELEKMAYLAKVRQYLLNYNSEESKFKTIRFSHLDNQHFLNADPLFTQNFPLPKIVNSKYMQYFLGKDSYEDTVISNGLDFVKVNGIYFRVISLYPDFPEIICDNYLNDIGDYVVQFVKINQETAVAKMEFKRNIFNGARYKEKRDVEGTGAYYEAENFLENLKKGSEALFHAEVFLIIRAFTEEELAMKTENLKSYLASLSLPYLIESESLSVVFPSLMFGIEAERRRSIMVDGSYLLNLLPLKKEFIHERGSRFFSTDNESQSIYVDLFDKSSHNYNALFIGPSGNGKSWLVQKICQDMLAHDVGGIIFDLGVSHLKYCLYHNAKIFSSHFNPMQFRDPTYLHALILSVVPEAELNFKDRGMILKQIKSAIAEDINTFRGLISHIEKESPGFSLYFEELFEFVTDEHCQIDRLVYIDTSAYPDKVKAPLIIFLFEYFEHIEGKKVFVFDECWSFLKSVGWFIQERFRTLRRKNASAIAISQGFDEFLSTDMGRAIVENCFHKFIFQQSVKSNDVLSEFDVQATLEVNSVKGKYSEFYYKSANHKKKLRCYGTPREQELFTSEMDDNDRLEAFFYTLGEGHSFKTLFDTYMKTFHPGNYL
jgi:TraG P-loop domain